MEIKKEYFNKLKYKIELPTIICKCCGEEVLVTPENLILNEFEKQQELIEEGIDALQKAKDDSFFELCEGVDK
jgi:hypothetical protein